MNHTFWILTKDKQIQPVNAQEYIKWVKITTIAQKENHDHLRVAESRVGVLGEIWISTVFMGVNHRFGEGPPLLFETLVFSESHKQIDGMCMRTSTWAEAEIAHQDMVERVQDRLNGT